jgi:cytochrome c-type biogenesis protein CcmF
MDFIAHRFGANGFLGEHLWLGNLGYFLLTLSFCTALLSCISYAMAEWRRHHIADGVSWLRMGRAAFIIHGVSVLSVFVLLFLMILNHWFEYHYAWRHSSKSLPIYYIISSFWEGQEGSFLLWQLWLVILGVIGIRTFKDWEQPVMTVTALTQVFLGSMVLGVYVLGYKVGSNPFVLLRHEMAQAPIFQRPEYLSMIADGNGLNPLLQNYWMTIHPPVLFCGFASTVFPFAFAMAALVRKDYEGWVKPALPWALFSIAILGTGILMGGAWAYESLSFGGFWAWDPVENMSLVPWLLIAAGLHLHLIFKHTKQGLFTTFLFYILGFILVLYSTFLTRSGILGDTSVHAFTDLGMSGQLVIYLFAFLIPAILLLAARYQYLPSPVQEEELESREFWMFVGSLILLFSALQQTFTTSIPVWNILIKEVFQLTDKKIAPPADVIAHYNSIQIWLAIFAALGTATVQYLAYKSKRVPSSIKWAIYSLVAAIVLTAIASPLLHIDWLTPITVKGYQLKMLSPQILMLVTAIYAALANAVYLVAVIKNNIKISGGAITHFGFGVFLVGVLISQYKKETISLNKAGVLFGKEFSNKELAENMLMVLDSTYHMGDYDVTYKGEKINRPNNLYRVDYLRKGNDGSVKETFSLFPNAQINPKMGMVANPDTKHYWDKDVFTHVSSLPDKTKDKDTLMRADISVGDTIYTKTSFVIFTAINPKAALPANEDAKDKLVVGAQLHVKSMDGTDLTAEPVYAIDMHDNTANSYPYKNETTGMDIDILRINPESKKFTITVRERIHKSDFIILKAIVFPYINLVWLGGIVMFFGVFFSMRRRMREV